MARDTAADVVARERVSGALSAIEQLDSDLHAVIRTCENEATASAGELAPESSPHGTKTPLYGLPIGVKDNIDVAGLPTTSGSAFLGTPPPEGSATVIERLESAGCLIVAKLNLHEFAFGATTQNPHHGSCRNPWDLDRIPGGSSGGSAAAVAAGMVPLAIGTDTAASVRLPAALCGVSGIRPSVGLVPRTGVFPVSFQFDTVGPMARSVCLLAAALEAMAGFDSADPMSASSSAIERDSLLGQEMAGMRVGVPQPSYLDVADESVVALFDDAVAVLADAGASIVEVHLPSSIEAQRDLMTIMCADAASVHRSWLESYRRADYGEDVLERLLSGLATTGVDYSAAARKVLLWRRAVDDVFWHVDAVVTPTTPTTAPRIDDERLDSVMGKLRIYTYPWALSLGPSLSVPCGFDSNGLPVGLQVCAPRWGEDVVLTIGHAYQMATSWHEQQPRLTASPDAISHAD